ncbi:hypothetical protein PFLUV_G00080970 [Perca fluviatilis]|uniref:Uncharacterized protein n=1 Tax=Perca fluviatilis TaxID=8168 RepID=A0A6A5FD50_PERFL|nr:hypothetical protein PFLUV_G00080970 [Perca fluviatilis]
MPISSPLVVISSDAFLSSQSGWICHPGGDAGTARHSNQQTEEEDVSTSVQLRELPKSSLSFVWVSIG